MSKKIKPKTWAEVPRSKRREITFLLFSHYEMFGNDLDMLYSRLAVKALCAAAKKK